MGGQWSEVDFAARVWTVPAARMKGGREPRVPLSDRATQIRREMQDRKVSEFIFPGSKPNRPLSVMTLELVLRRAKIDVTVHGFRIAFRDWSGERTSFRGRLPKPPFHIWSEMKPNGPIVVAMCSKSVERLWTRTFARLRKRHSQHAMLKTSRTGINHAVPGCRTLQDAPGRSRPR